MNKQRLAIVFGGSRGIGAACVGALAEDGFDVAYTHVSGSSEPPAVAGRRIHAGRGGRPSGHSAAGASAVPTSRRSSMKAYISASSR